MTDVDDFSIVDSDDVSSIVKKIVENLVSTDCVSNITAPNLTPLEVGIAEQISNYDVTNESFYCRDYLGLIDSGVEYLRRANAIREDATEIASQAFHSYVSLWRACQNSQHEKKRLEGSVGLEICEAEQHLALLNDMEFEKYDDRAKVVGDRSLTAGKIRLLNKQRAELDKQINTATTEIDMRLQQLRENGGALNFTERYENASRHFRDNLLEAHARLRAAAFGAAAVHKKSQEKLRSDGLTEYVFDPFPNIDSSNEIGSVDTLLKWVRNMLFKVSRLSKFERRLTIRRVKDVGGQKGIHFSDSDYPDLLDLRVAKVRMYALNSNFKLDSVSAFMLVNGTYKGIVVFPNDDQHKGLVVPNHVQGDVSRYTEEAESDYPVAYVNAPARGTWDVSISDYQNETYYWGQGKLKSSKVWLEIELLGTNLD